MEEVIDSFCLERRMLGLRENVSKATDGEPWDLKGVATRAQEGPGVD